MWNRNKPEESTSEYELLETDVYVMKIAKAEMVENRFETNDDGTHPEQLALTWEDQDSGTWVTQYINPWYGKTKRGPSKFMALVDSFAEQGLLPDEFGVDDFEGIVQRCTVEKYQKTKGENAGSFGNKITSVLPLERKKAAPANNGNRMSRNNPQQTPAVAARANVGANAPRRTAVATRMPEPANETEDSELQF